MAFNFNASGSANNGSSIANLAALTKIGLKGRILVDAIRALTAGQVMGILQNVTALNPTGMTNTIVDLAIKCTSTGNFQLQSWFNKATGPTSAVTSMSGLPANGSYIRFQAGYDHSLTTRQFSLFDDAGTYATAADTGTTGALPGGGYLYLNDSNQPSAGNYQTTWDGIEIVDHVMSTSEQWARPAEGDTGIQFLARCADGSGTTINSQVPGGIANSLGIFGGTPTWITPTGGKMWGSIPTTFTLAPSAPTINLPAGTVTLSPSILDQGSNAMTIQPAGVAGEGVPIDWSSGTPADATVTTSGVVAAVLVGSSVITGSVHHASPTKTATDTVTVAAAPQVLTTITVSGATVPISGNSGTVPLSALGYDATHTLMVTQPTFAWTVDVPGMTVSATGLVTATTACQGIVTATSGGVSGTFVVSAVVPQPYAATISPSNPTLGTGQTQQMAVAVSDQFGAPMSAGYTVAWSSSAPATLSIDPVSGLATQHAAGTAVITATVRRSEGTTLEQLCAAHGFDFALSTNPAYEGHPNYQSLYWANVAGGGVWTTENQSRMVYVQASAGVFTFTTLDAQILKARTNGCKIRIYLLDGSQLWNAAPYSPLWLGGTGGTGGAVTSSGTATTQLYAWIDAVVARYAGLGIEWIINEPLEYFTAGDGYIDGLWNHYLGHDATAGWVGMSIDRIYLRDPSGLITINLGHGYQDTGESSAAFWTNINAAATALKARTGHKPDRLTFEMHVLGSVYGNTTTATLQGRLNGLITDGYDVGFSETDVTDDTNLSPGGPASRPARDAITANWHTQLIQVAAGLSKLPKYLACWQTADPECWILVNAIYVRSDGDPVRCDLYDATYAPKAAYTAFVAAVHAMPFAGTITTTTGATTTGSKYSYTALQPTIASVDANGNITAQALGAATIDVVDNRAPTVIGTITITDVAALVPSSVVITPAGGVVASLTAPLQLSAVVDDQTGAPMAGRIIDWSSNNANVPVNSSGLVTATLAGQTATITAKDHLSPTTAIATVTVTTPAAATASVAVTPSTLSITDTNPHTLTASALDQFNVTMGVQPAFTWTSSNAAVVTAGLTTGQVTGVNNGSATVTADAGNGVHGTCIVTCSGIGTGYTAPNLVSAWSFGTQGWFPSSAGNTSTHNPEGAWDSRANCNGLGVSAADARFKSGYSHSIPAGDGWNTQFNASRPTVCWTLHEFLWPIGVDLSGNGDKWGRYRAAGFGAMFGSYVTIGLTGGAFQIEIGFDGAEPGSPGHYGPHLESYADGKVHTVEGMLDQSQGRLTVWLDGASTAFYDVIASSYTTQPAIAILMHYQTVNGGNPVGRLVDRYSASSAGRIGTLP